MDGDGFDVWGSQPSASGPGHAPEPGSGFDLNSQAPALEGFPGLGLYGAILHGDDHELLPGRARGVGLPPYHPPRSGSGDGRATSAPYARQLNFGVSSSAAAGRVGGNGGVFPGGSSSGVGGAIRQRANSAAAAPGRRGQRSYTASRASGQGVPRPRAPRAPRSAVRGQASASGAPFDNDQQLEDDVEELGSSGVPPVSQYSRAQWNDTKNACLLELCIEQRAAGMYNGSQMTAEGYQAVIDGFFARKGLVINRGQVKNQLIILKAIHTFWRYMQAHTGLGRNPDGSVDAESDFWIEHTEKKPYLKKLQWGPPANEDLLDQLWRGYTVDGSTSFVPGADDGEIQELGSEEEEDCQTTPRTTTPTSTSFKRSEKGKRTLSTSSTLTSPVKKSKSPMVKAVTDIASTFKESVKANTKQLQKRASEKAACSVERCQQLAFECGVEESVEAVYAMAKMFELKYQREFFCGKLTPELRLGYFKKWCRDNNFE